MTKKDKNNISLVKTDYDNFRDLSFFLEQQRKAEAMLREVEDFKKSFVMSKMFNARDFFKENPLHGITFFEPEYFVIEYDDNDKVESMYITMTTGNFMAPQGSSSIFQSLYHKNFDPHSSIYEKLPNTKKAFLNKFYKYIFQQRYCVKNNNLMLQEYSREKGSYLVDFDESRTLYLIDNCKRFINEELIDAAKEKYIKEASKDYKKGCAPKIKFFRFNFSSYSDKDYKELFKTEELIEYFEKVRFKDEVEFLKNLYVQNAEIMANWWRKKNSRNFYPDLDKKNFVLYKDELVWVTNNPDEVQINTSKNRKSIICEFRDQTEYATYAWPTDGPRIVDTRIIELKYSAKNNELEKVDIRHDTYEYQPKRHY